MLKFGDWINRKRHNRGFGIQSPSAFFFITQVLREKLPYYAYDRLDLIAECCNDMSAKRCRRLFRIANDVSPASAITVASATAACAIGSACSRIPKQFISNSKDTNPEVVRHLADCGCSRLCGNTLQLLKKCLEENKGAGLLYIGPCDNQKELLKAAMEQTNKESVIIVEGIHRSKRHFEWWQQAISDPRTIVTYDMYSMGILFFNSERPKQNYTLKI
ncbi:MAG: hypothetical protein J6R07_04275 [Bacteroidaceae bacterium]|nr:hypothetical protein [Bacteroidaceae bacterium]